MKAAVIQQPGSPDVFQISEVPSPSCGPTEVVVKIAVSAVNPIDTYFRSGAIEVPGPFPLILGCDFAGTVEEVGPDVSKFQVGDRVWGSNQGLFGQPGTLAEKIAVDEKWAYHTPENMSDQDAAAGALTGITAQLGLFLHGRLQSGETVFVNGGTGGVGSMVVQFAKAAGAKVVTTAGAEEKQQLARELGADDVLDYRSENLENELRDAAASSGGFDIWWETQREPNLPLAIPTMKKRGRIILMAGREAQPQFPLGPFYVNDLQMLGFAMFNASADEQRDCAERMNSMWSAGKWKPVIGQTFSLDNVASAHQLQEDNTLGKAHTVTGKILVEI